MPGPLTGEAVGVKRRHLVRPVQPPKTAFAGFRFPPDVILIAVRWYLRYGLSHRDLEELLAERGVEVDHVTLFRWVQRFTPLLIDAAQPCRHRVGGHWFVDEIYVKVSGTWRYVYRAVDQYGDDLLTLSLARGRPVPINPTPFHVRSADWKVLLMGVDEVFGTHKLTGGSTFGKSGKITLGLPIPTHSLDGVPPPALHFLQGTFVRGVPVGDHLFEMSILRLDDLVCGRALVRSFARPTKLLTCHGLHELRFLSL